MWAKERWESRWRVPIMNAIGCALAISFPFIFQLIQNVPPHAKVDPILAMLQHYPNLAFGWFGEDLPELLLVYVVILAIAMITREWQSGTIEFVAQLPSTPSRIAWLKGLWGSLELAVVAIVSSAVLYAVSLIAGHTLPVMPWILSVLLMTVGFIGMWWLLSAFAWAIHSTYAVILIGLGIYVIGMVSRSVRAWRTWSPFTYMINVSPHPKESVLWEHLLIVIGATAVMAGLALWVAGRQEFIPNHRRDQI